MEFQNNATMVLIYDYKFQNRGTKLFVNDYLFQYKTTYVFIIVVKTQVPVTWVKSKIYASVKCYKVLKKHAISINQDEFQNKTTEI